MPNTPHPSPRLLSASSLRSPIAGSANVNRTDEGKDWGNIRGKIVAIGAGVISNIYQGLSGFGTTIIEHLSSPVSVDGREYTDIYYGLESGGGTPTVHPGDTVQAGTEVAPGLGSGGIEVGFWDTSAGRAVDASSYSEGGPPTQAGQDFVKAIGGGGVARPGGEPAGGSSGGGGSSKIPAILGSYVALRDMPRTSPPGGNPASLWWQSFTGRWQEMVAAGASSGGGSGGSAPADSAPGSPLGDFIATAYGPPWGGIEGGGQTATGIDLMASPHDYLVAVDPSVIPLHSKVKISPNPFGDPNIVFRAEDTGGAIKGNRIDFYDWRGRASQNSWGRRPVKVSVLN